MSPGDENRAVNDDTVSQINAKVVRKMPSNTPKTKPVQKPFVTGKPFDENTVKSSLLFLGSLFVVILMCFIVCSATGLGSQVLSIILNGAVLATILIVFFSNGTSHGSDAVTRGEILYQKIQKGQPVTDSEKSVCFHRFKGFLIGLLGTLPLLVLAVIFAVTVQPQTTDSGTLPSWLQSYLRRSDVGGALMHYTNPESMNFFDFLRVVIRITLMPYVNMVGASNRTGIFLVERLSPLLVLLPAIAYGTGYLGGRKVRAQIHTAIFESNRKRARKEKKRQQARARGRGSNPREPEKLN